MSLEIVPTKYFNATLKRLKKKYRTLTDDLDDFSESLKKDPHQGVEIAPHVRKVRLAITAKGRGKSGGARVITYDALVTERGGKLYLLVIYDKAEASNVRMDVIREIIADLQI